MIDEIRFGPVVFMGYFPLNSEWMILNSNLFSLHSFSEFPVNKSKHSHCRVSPQMEEGERWYELTSASSYQQAFIFLQFLFSVDVWVFFLFPFRPPPLLPSFLPDFLSFFSSSTRIYCAPSRLLIGTQRWTVVLDALGWNNRKPNSNWLKSLTFICFWICKFQ